MTVKEVRISNLLTKGERALFKLAYFFTRNKKYKQLKQKPYLINGENNKIIIIEDGKEKVLAKNEIIENIHIEINGNNNEIKLEFPFKTRLGCSFILNNDNNKVDIKKNSLMDIHIVALEGNNTFKFMECCQGFDVHINLVGNSSFQAGRHCLFSNNIDIIDDGHSIIDKDSRELLNEAGCNIEIGEHCWIGRNVVLLKKAKIPKNCVIPVNSVVTKEFQEENCIIAGNPAKICKRGINWHRTTPKRYNKETVSFDFD